MIAYYFLWSSSDYEMLHIHFFTYAKIIHRDIVERILLVLLSQL